MNKIKMLMIILVSGVFLFSGCLLLSGTFTIKEKFSLGQYTSGFYSYQMNITDNDDWQDHKDDIENIDLVGFELWITNQNSEDIVLNAYLDDGSNTLHNSINSFTDSEFIILDSLTLSGSESTHLTYAESFQYVMNVDSMKTLVKSGLFNFYATNSSKTSSNFVIDSGYVIVTFTAHN